MYSKVYSIAPRRGIRGTHHNSGSPYTYYVQQQEGTINGLVGRIRLTPFSIVTTATTTLLPGTSLDLNTASPADVFWSGTTLKASTTATRLYKYPTAPSGGLLSSIDPASLPAIVYDSPTKVFPETGSPGNFYAVYLGSGSNYAVLHLFSPSAGVVKAEWITYQINTAPTPWPSVNCPEPWDILVTSNDGEAYISGNDSAGNGHIFRIPNSGTSDNPNFYVSDYFNHIIDDGSLSEPRQLAFYNSKLYVVDEKSLWCIDVNAGTQEMVVGGLINGVGLLINDNTGKAIVSDSTGQMYEVDLKAATRVLTPLPATLSLPGPSGFLAWADSSYSAFYVAMPDPVNSVIRVDLAAVLRTTVLDSSTPGSPFDPWSVETLSDYRLLVAGTSEIGTLELTYVSNVLLLGIGLVPFDYINNASMTPPPATIDLGKADTSRAPGYFYQVKNVPFGGDLNLMINHKLAWETKLRYYRVTLIRPDGTSRVIDNAFTDLRFSSVAGRYLEVSTSTTGPTGTPVANAFMVRDQTDDSKQPWYNPYLGAIIHTTTRDNGLCTLQVEFFDGAGTAVPGGKFSRLIRINNNPAATTLFLPRIGGPGVSPAPGIYPDTDCGCITYGSKDDRVELDFTAWHPDGFASYSLAVYRGDAYLAALAESGPADLVSTLHTKTRTTLSTTSFMKVGHILGDCNVATIGISVSVPINIIDGYRPVYWLSASSSRVFTLVPKTVTLSSPWVDPGN